MNTYETAGHNTLSLLESATSLAPLLEGMVDIIAPSFRKEDLAKKIFILMEPPGTEWFGKLDRSGKDFPGIFDPIAGKSIEEIRAIRKESVLAIHKSHAAIAKTIAELARVIRNRSLDSETESKIRNDLDVRFNRLRRKLDKDEKTLGECNTALSKMFTRRSSDNRAHEQSVHI